MNRSEKIDNLVDLLDQNEYVVICANNIGAIIVECDVDIDRLTEKEEDLKELGLSKEDMESFLKFLEKNCLILIDKSEVMGVSFENCLYGIDELEKTGLWVEEQNEQIDKFEQFVKDMEGAGIDYEEYNGRFFYHGPAVRTKEDGFPTLQDVIRSTKMKLQWDNFGKDDFIIYPA